MYLTQKLKDKMDDNSSDDNCEIDKDASPSPPKRPKIGAGRYLTSIGKLIILLLSLGNSIQNIVSTVKCVIRI